MGETARGERHARTGDGYDLASRTPVSSLSVLLSLLTARVITTAMAAVMAAVCFSPLLLAAAYIIFRPFIFPYSNMKHLYYGGVPLSALFSAVIIGAIAFSLVVKRGFSLAITGQMTFYLFIMLCLPSIALSPDHGESVAMLLKYLTSVGFAILIHNAVREPEDVYRVFVVFALATLGPVGFAYYQKYTGYLWPWTRYSTEVGRVNSLFGQWNEYGIFLSLSLCSLAVLILIERRRWLKAIWLLLAGSAFVSLIQSLNRGSWIALFCGAVFAYPLYFKKVRMLWIVTGFTVVALAFSSVIIQRFEKLDSVDQFGNSEDTLSRRVGYWRGIVRLVAKHPVIGWGLGSAETVTAARLNKNMPPHNDYLRVLLECGVLGLAGMLVYLATQWFSVMSWAVHQDRWRVNLPVLVAVNYFGIILVTQNIISNVVLLPLFMGIMAAAHRWNRLPAPPAGR